MKIICKILLLIICICTGCAWIRVANKPVLREIETIPVSVGIKIESDQKSHDLVPLMVNYLKEFKVFNSIIYPFTAVDQVDGILEIKINGKWGKNILGGILAIWPPFMFSTFMGPTRTGRHETRADLIFNQTTSVSYTFTTETKIKYGIMANKSIVTLKGDSLQAYKIAYQIAGNLLMDQEKIIIDFKKK